jgi:hypothetical protein
MIREIPKKAANVTPSDTAYLTAQNPTQKKYHGFS